VCSCGISIGICWFRLKKEFVWVRILFFWIIITENGLWSVWRCLQNDYWKSLPF
jgi:hypothetical protein